MGKKLALFFTSGVSLKRWDKVGNLDREIKPYKRLIESGEFEEVYFFTYGRNDKKYENKKLPEGIKVFPNKYNFSNRVYSLLLPLLYWKKLKKVDILKTNQMRGGWAAVLAKYFFNTPLVVRCGYEWLLFSKKKKVSHFRLLLVRWLERFVYKNADKIFISSNKAKNFIKSNFAIKEEKITLLPNYIDTSLFSPSRNKNFKNRICFVGKFAAQKNIFSLLDSVDGLDIKLDLLGSGELESQLKKKVQDIKKAKINFIKNMPNDQVPCFLNKHSIFVLPSYYEGNPKAVLEAMSCGLACVGTDVDGTNEIIKNGDNGMLCDTDSGSIRKAIKKLLSNEKLRNRISKNARDFIVNSFSLDQIVKIEAKTYSKLISK